MQAEKGALFGGNMESLPPEAETEFLKNIQLFEDSFDKAKQISIYERIGSTANKRTEELKPGEVKDEVKRMGELLHSKNIILEVMGQYELSVIYKIITGENQVRKPSRLFAQLRLRRIPSQSSC